MHPNVYLRTFWRSTFANSVFVAMSFAEPYKKRFEEVIKPAIEDTEYRGQKLKANRVDLSQTGDSILTDIIDGIAHSVMVLADCTTSVIQTSCNKYAYPPVSYKFHKNVLHCSSIKFISNPSTPC